MTRNNYRLNVILPVRFSEEVFRLLESQVWQEKISSDAEFVRRAVVDALIRRGVEVKVPEPLNVWQELERKAEQIKANEQTKIDESLFPPLT